MKKQKKQLIALCILLLICIVAWVGLTKWNKSQEQKKQEEEEASKVMVTDVNTEDVNAFSYQYNNETLSFVKEDDTWYYEADKSIALDQDAVETLVTTAAQLTAEQEIKDYEDLSEYGLETPSNTITLTTGDGTTTLLIGNKNDMLSQYYVKTDQSNSIYLAGSAVYTSCTAASSWVMPSTILAPFLSVKRSSSSPMLSYLPDSSQIDAGITTGN
jgi:hypothetical protein